LESAWRWLGVQLRTEDLRQIVRHEARRGVVLARKETKAPEAGLDDLVIKPVPDDLVPLYEAMLDAESPQEVLDNLRDTGWDITPSLSNFSRRSPVPVDVDADIAEAEADLKAGRTVPLEGVERSCDACGLTKTGCKDAPNEATICPDCWPEQVGDVEAGADLSGTDDGLRSAPSEAALEELCDAVGKVYMDRGGSGHKHVTLIRKAFRAQQKVRAALSNGEGA
jgi:hypothetical protein